MDCRAFLIKHAINVVTNHQCNTNLLFFVNSLFNIRVIGDSKDVLMFISSSKLFWGTYGSQCICSVPFETINKFDYISTFSSYATHRFI